MKTKRTKQGPRHCSNCGQRGHDVRNCGRPLKVVAAKATPNRALPTVEALRANGRGAIWTRPDGRSLHMPWTVDELWVRLCRATFDELEKPSL